jgi:hypothetical protein
MRRILAGAVGLFDAVNGVAMLVAPAAWFAAVPGVHGAFNDHFVQDVGAAFLAAGLGLLARAWEPRWWPAAAAGAGFLGLHAGLHVVGWLDGHATAADLLLVVVPALLAAYAAIPGGGADSVVVWAVRKFGERYDYDTTYLQAMFREAPSAFWRFALLNVPANHRSAAPVDAWFAAKLVGAVSEDCGPCTQLVVNMARAAGVNGEQLQAVLRRDPGAMGEDVALGFRFATAVIERTEDEDAAREAVVARWGRAGVVDLTLAFAIGRVYPMTKAGLGYAKECRLVVVDGAPVSVVHAEAS